MSMITRSSKTGSTEGLRNRFFARKRMLADDFKIEQDYFINSQRLINRAILGWGVVYGFKIEGATPPAPCDCGNEKKQDTTSEAKEDVEASGPVATGSAAQMQQAGSSDNTSADAVNNDDGGAQDPKPKPFPLEVGSGFALDKAGRNVVLRTATTLTAENTILFVRKGDGWIAKEIDGDLKSGHYVLAVHYAETKAGGTVSPSLCCCGELERTHLCEDAMFSLRQDICRCGEPDCAPDGRCVSDACCNRSRGPHARLAAWATGRQDDAGGELCTWHGIEIARREGVDLACVVIDIAPDKCKPISVSKVDESSPRRVVKTSDTLYDLLNGCDLTRIDYVSWSKWHRSDPYRGDEAMPWETFAALVSHQSLTEETMQTDFVVRFSGPGTLERPLYSPGLLLEDTDLTSAVDYTRQLTKMLFSSLFGCGVICGLRVNAKLICENQKLSITVDKGLGLDCFGNPIEVPGLQTMTLNLVCPDYPLNIWVVACYVDKECAPRELSCGCDTDQDRAFTRHRAGFEIKIYEKMPGDACSCEKPQPDKNGRNHRCCGDDDAAEGESTADGKPEQGCYDDHMDGKCSCGCGCNCIVIGKITISTDTDNKLVVDASDRSAVRDIRPVPVGHYLKENPKKQQPAADGTGTTTIVNQA